MKRNFASQSAFLDLRLMSAVVFCAAGIALSAIGGSPQAGWLVDDTDVSCGSGGVLAPWSTVADYPGPNGSPAVASNGVFAYAAGGGYSSGTSGFYRYDPAINSWTPLAPLPMALYKARAAYAANTNFIYVFGGYDGVNI